MEITAAMVKELRDKTAAGFMDCKKALQEAGGDMDKAFDILREKGAASSDKKADRIAAEGLVDCYLHNGKIGAMVEVNSETDFVARNQDFIDFVHKVCMQVAAQAPKYVSRDQVPAEEVEHEKSVLIEQAKNESPENMPEDKKQFIAEKKVEGRMDKFYARVCLMDQESIFDSSKTIEEERKELVAKVGENIVVRRFTRFEVGEGLEKRQDDLAAEVEKQLNAAEK